MVSPDKAPKRSDIASAPRFGQVPELGLSFPDAEIRQHTNRQQAVIRAAYCAPVFPVAGQAGNSPERLFRPGHDVRLYLNADVPEIPARFADGDNILVQTVMADVMSQMILGATELEDCDEVLATCETWW